MNIKKYLKWKTLTKKQKATRVIVVIIIIAYYFCLPSPLFDKPYSTVIESKDEQLLGAQIASDGQWRFPELDTVPYKFKQAILAYEDEYFHYHWGVNPVSTIKALATNFKQDKIKRGGSTITQQTIRIARDGQKRNYYEKLIEAIQATRLEFKYSKEKILALYASHAPFGGNVVGLDVAAWRYFGTTPEQLSWAESATLAVLPNAPRLIYPGKNQETLLRKRNQLLLKLKEKEILDEATYELALLEPLPQKPHELPQLASHLLQQVNKTNRQEKVITTIDYTIQNRTNDIVQNYYNIYRQSEIYNMSAIVIDIETRNIVAYVGNTPTTSEYQKDVDIIQAPRSTGSILKPFLYGAMLDDAEILPKTIVADIPTVISGYKPQNFNMTYEGAVPADEALFRSLNIPFVLMLQQYGVYRFYDQLQKLELKHINKHPNHYGLSLILGGGESSLWDITRAYTSMASTLNYYNSSKGYYRNAEVQNLNYIRDKQLDFGTDQKEKSIMGAGAIYNTFKALTQVNRPEGDEAWQYYDSAIKIAWKTGTSFGGRDAWAVGVNKKYVVGIWVGNATGEGRPSISGVRMAGPILFDIFKLLPKSNWFSEPLNDMDEIDACSISGYLAGPNCTTVKTLIPHKAKKTIPCPYHQLIHLDMTEMYRVNSTCELVDNIVIKPWFSLPPTIAFFYKKYHSEYKDLPPFRADCIDKNAIKNLEFIYPKHENKIYLTKDFNSQLQPLVAKAATNNASNTLHWYIDETYIGSTTYFHEQPIMAKPGKHLLTITDSDGNSKTIEIEIDYSSNK
ncbi:MAG: penicillin-binding protein 1C [Flavobacteriaceae bacterium]|jgi:penicillin-binding protein 1C|nr:penicillin-binding protein 1C [Flavobacteriaceae bacterium]